MTKLCVETDVKLCALTHLLTYFTGRHHTVGNTVIKTTFIGNIIFFESDITDKLAWQLLTIRGITILVRYYTCQRIRGFFKRYSTVALVLPISVIVSGVV